MVAGRRRFCPLRDDPMVAHQDAVELRKQSSAAAGGRHTLREAADAMHAELETTRAAGTVRFYRQQAVGVFRFVREDLPIEKLTAEVLQFTLVRAAQAEGLSTSTIRHYRSWLHRLLTWAAKPQRRWFTLQDPLPLVSWPDRKQGHSPDVFSEAEIAKILAGMADSPADRDLTLLFAFSGLRRAEVGRLHVRDLDFDRRVIWVRGKVRDEAVPITAELLAPCTGLVSRALGGYLVAGANDQRRAEWLGRWFARWARRLGERRFHAHALRHSLATNLIRRGVQSGVVQRFLRHSNYTTTQRYVHLVAEDLHTASARLAYVEGEAPEASKSAT